MTKGRICSRWSRIRSVRSHISVSPILIIDKVANTRDPITLFVEVNALAQGTTFCGILLS